MPKSVDGVVDYYRILGVPKSATTAEIKQAYRRLALTHHPDKYGDMAQIVLINEAYATLKNADKRAKYDVVHAMNFGSVAQFVHKIAEHWQLPKNLKDNLRYAERQTSHLRMLGRAHWRQNSGQFLKNAAAIFAKMQSLTKQTSHDDSHDDMTKLRLSSQLADNGGEVYFMYQGRKVRTVLPKGLKQGAQIKLIIDGVPVWLVIEIYSDK